MSVRPDGAASIQGCAIRVTRLNSDGSPAIGQFDMYQQDAIVKVTAKNNILKGTEILIQTACGSIYDNYKDYDRIKYLDVTVEIVDPDPEASELLSVGSGAVITVAGSSVGYQIPPLNQQNQPAGCGIEVWTKAITAGFQVPGDRVVTDGVTNTDTSLVSATANFTAADVGSLVRGTGISAGTSILTVTNSTTVVLAEATTASNTGVTVTILSRSATPWYRWLMPRMYLLPDGVSVENKATPWSFTGFAIENPLWGVGPVGDWTVTRSPGGTALPSNRAMQYIRDLSTPAPLEPGYQSSTAPTSPTGPTGP